MPREPHILDFKTLDRFVRSVRKMLAAGVSISEVARQYHLSRTTVRKRLERWESLQKDSGSSAPVA